MDFLISNWALIVAATAVIVYIAWMLINTPAKIKEWLLYAVVLAEKELGSGTGRVKLRYVYDMFMERFPVLSKLIPFGAFSTFVDNSLDKMRDMLNSNVNVKNYIEQKGN